MNTLQRTIREIMDAKGWGPTDLSRASGLPRQTLYNLLAPANAGERRQPRPRTLHKIADALGVPPSRLLQAMNQTRGYETDPADVPDPSMVALLAVAELLDDKQRDMLVAMAKTMLRCTSAPDLVSGG